MLSFDVPAGVNTNALLRLLLEAGLNTSLVIEGTTVSLPELEEEHRSAVLAVWSTYQQRQAERKAVVDALQANQAFLAVASPTTAQAVAQVKALTQQINGLVTILARRGYLD